MWRTGEEGEVMGIFIVLFLLCNDVNSQMTGKVDPESAVNNNKYLRQLDIESCCPCPEDTDRNADIRYPASVSTIARYNGEFNSRHGNEFTDIDNMRTESHSPSLNDHLSQSWKTDSEGSPSFFFPIAATEHYSRTSNKKEVPVNLLEPEVGLAASVLETIREVTEAEYQDALARDLEKAREVDDTINSESAPNVVTIIMPNHNKGQEDNLLSRSRHIDDSENMERLSSSLSKMKTPIVKSNLLAKILKLSEEKSKGLTNNNVLDTDSNLQASTTQEFIMNKDLSDNEFRRDSEVLQPRENGRSIIDSKSSRKEAINEEKSQLSNTRLNNPAHKLRSEFPDSKPLSLLTKYQLFNAKNFLKLKDVDFIPPGKMTKRPLLKLSSIFEQQINNLTDFFRNGLSLKNNQNRWTNVKNCDQSSDFNAISTNNETISSERPMKTEIHETLSESKHSSINEDNPDSESKDNDRQDNTPHEIDELNTASNLQMIARNKINRTKTLDTITSPSENHIIYPNSNTEKSVTELLEDILGDGNGPFSSSNEDILPEEISYRNDEFPAGLFNSKFNVTADDESTAVLNREREPNDHQISEDYAETDDYGWSNTDSLEDATNCQQKSTDGDQEHLDSENIAMLSNEALNPNHNKLIRFPLHKNSVLKKENISEEKNQFRKTSTSPFDAINSEEKFVDRENPYNSDYDNAVLESSKFDLLEQGIIRSSINNNLTTFNLKDLQNMSDSLLRISELNEKSDDLKNEDTVNYFDNTTDMNLNVQEKASKAQSTNTCISETQLSKEQLDSSAPRKKAVESKDMFVDASDRIISAIRQGPLNLLSNLKSPVLQDIIVQPSSLLRDNLLPLPDASGLDLSSLLNIPTLDEIRERLGDLFENFGKESEVNDVDCDNNNVMSSKASEPKYKTIPVLQPLKDIDVDIFQLKPLDIGDVNLLPKTTRFNLKSYKAKLPVPKNIELKPMKLESTLGNQNGLLGASFKIGQESDISKNFKNILGTPMERSSRLEEIASHLKNNVESFLNRPLNIEQDLRSSSKINTNIDDLRLRALNNIKKIQENIENPLKVVQHNLLEQPGSLLENIADARQDFNDKLKGLQFDLNDRLSSIHENILDKTNLKSISNLLHDKEILQNIKLKPPQLRNPSDTTKEYYSPIGKNQIEKLLKPQSKAQFRNGNHQRSSHVKTGHDKLKSFKMSTSASVPVPQNMKTPDLKQIMATPSSSDLQRDPTIKPIIAQNMVRQETEKEATLRIPLQYGALSRNRPTNELNGSKDGIKKEKKIALSTRIPLVRSRNLKLTKTIKENPTRSESRLEKNRSSIKDNIDRAKSNSSLSLRSVLDSGNIDFLDLKRLRTKTDAKAPIKSSTIINPIKEWLKQRQAMKTMSGVSKNRSTSPASENSDIIVSDSLKENIPYICNFLCTKGTADWFYQNRRRY